MEKLFVNFLPPWVETNIQPAFYDKESGSVLQQTARMYAKVNCLVRMFNKLSKDTKETVDEYIAKFVELKDFVDTYFENLDVQEEINNKLDAMAEDGTLQQAFGEYSGVITPKMFGAVSGTDTDQSEAIKDCLDYCFEHGIKNVYLDGTYFVDDSIEYTGKSDITIKNGTLRVHETTAKLSAGFRPLSFIDSSNITIENVSIIETEPEARERNLYTGGIYFYNSTDCVVRDCYLENTYSGIIFKNTCKGCIAENNEILVNYHSSQFASSAILNYSSQDTVIKNNRITGEFYDGALSVYGGYCKNVTVDGNILKGVFDNETLYLSEGICVDAAPEHTIVVNNNVSGFYYGIDNKNDSRNTLIANNLCHGNKVSICDRPGEENKQTFNCEIRNNEITIETLWDTDTLGDALYKSTFYYVGIYCPSRLSATIQNNKINLFRKSDDKIVCGIIADGSTLNVNNIYQGQFDITGNTIEFANGWGVNSWYAPANSVGFYLGDIQKGTITNNSLKVDTYGNKYVMFELSGANNRLLITNNTFLSTSLDSHYFVELLTGATITNSSVINNLLKNCVPKWNLGSASNLVQMPRYDIIAHQIPKINLTYNTWSTVATITPRYGALTHIKVYAIKAAGGNKYLFGEYILDIGTDSVMTTSLSEEKSGLEIQFVHGTNSKDCDIQIRPGSNINNFDELFFTELMGEQNLVIA